MSDNSVEKYRTDLVIVKETAEQVLKDFGIFGIEINFSGNPFTAFEELKKQLTPILFELFQNDKMRFQSLLYRIDVNEKVFKKLIGNSTGNEFPAALAEIILQREFQKVLTRRFFSK